MPNSKSHYAAATCLLLLFSFFTVATAHQQPYYVKPTGNYEITCIVNNKPISCMVKIVDSYLRDIFDVNRIVYPAILDRANANDKADKARAEAEATITVRILYCLNT